MPITLEHIAKLSSVSRSTVSRVINGDINVKDETRERVLKVIKEVNFQPNLAARSLARGRSEVIGLVIPAGLSTIFTDPYFLHFTRSVSTACNENEYNVMLWLAEPENERKMIQKILHGGLLDGVLVSSMVVDDPLVNSLYTSKMPFVLVGRHPSLDIDYVDTDNVAGGYIATKHLIDLGYKNIAAITGPLNLIAGVDRFEGYKKAFKDHNLSVNMGLVEEGDFSEEKGYSAMKKLLSHKPDAVFVANDTMALGALRAIREENLKVPEDIAIVGYDDIPGAAKTFPPLTTVKQDIEAMGQKAVNILLEIISYSNIEKKNDVLEPQLIIRDSCGYKKNR